MSENANYGVRVSLNSNLKHHLGITRKLPYLRLLSKLTLSDSGIALVFDYNYVLGLQKCITNNSKDYFHVVSKSYVAGLSHIVIDFTSVTRVRKSSNGKP